MKAYERLIKYAKIYTTSDPTSENNNKIIKIKQK